jgi:two-component system sensor histidine kinase RegB
MAVVAGEMKREASTPSLLRDVDILASQIEACRQTISNLLAAADHARAEGGGRERLDASLQAIANRFRRMRPDVVFTYQWEGEQPVPQIFAEQALKQSVFALLNNAADASPNDVRMTARWDEETLHVAIGDRGSGMPPGHLEKLGRMFFTTKPPGKGTGLGLVLAANAIKHLGGTLRWENRAGGGTQAEMVLLLRALKLPDKD